MMGRQNNDQGHLFYEFRLDEAVPDDHLVRKIDAVSIYHGSTQRSRRTIQPSAGPRLIRY
jgi:hypothetical protein